MYLALKNALGKSFILSSGLLNKFSGATAAYSLRDLSNTYGGPIVKVRRATDQEEEEFNSYEVNQIEDWVNGKQETTLPANVASSAAAYSLRKVNSSYPGDVVRIRRVSDATEVNVGFDSGDKVSTTSPITVVSGSTTASTLGAFLTEGGNQDATVHTWYDQSGNAKDATQDTTGSQPKIAEAGIIKTQGGKPCLDFDGVDDGLVTSDSYTTTGWGFAVYDPTSNTEALVSNSNNLALTVGSQMRVGSSGNNEDFTLPNLNQQIGSFNFGSTAECFINGAAISKDSDETSPANSSKISIGFRDGDLTPSLFWSSTISEVILYSTDQSSNRFKIESNINNYYGIYIASNDGFVSKWHDQSGNSSHATQTSTDLQPQIVTSGSLNTVNGKPSIKWDGVDDFMVASISGFKDITNLSSFHVVTPVDAAAADTSTMTAFSFGVISSGTNRGLSLASSTGATGISGETITLSHESSGATTGRLASTSYSRASNTQSLLSLFNLSSGTSLFAQGSSVTLNLSNQINTSSDTSPSGTGFTSNNNVYLGGIFTTTPVALEEESFQEIIFFDANKTSDRTSIESNIDDYYDII